MGGYRNLRLAGMGIAAAYLLAAPFVVSEGSARPGAPARAAPAPARPAPVAARGAAAPVARAIAAPHIGGLGHRLGGGRSGVGGSASRVTGGIRSAGHFSGFTGPGGRFAGSPGHGLTTAAALSYPGRHPSRLNAAFGRAPIGNPAFRSAFVRGPLFRGRFHGAHGLWWRGGIVIGWIGPVFWPYAYDDFFDYVFWPYAYDDFWPYAYEDVYYGIYGGYGYVDPTLRVLGRRAPAQDPERAVVAVCGQTAPELTDWPIGRIAEVIEPTEAQRAALDELKGSTAKAVELLRASCPNDLPSVPPGRLAAMESRLEVMLAAVKTVRPSLDGLYQSLSDEQKARFNAVAPVDASGSTRKEQRDFARLCAKKEASFASLPLDRIARAVHPTEQQQASLDELRIASAKASEQLKGNCPAYQPLTATGRIEAMEKRLEAMLEAARAVRPALANFYSSLSDEQKARFNTLGSNRIGV
jgi:hypothetical protein